MQQRRAFNVILSSKIYNLKKNPHILSWIYYFQPSIAAWALEKLRTTSNILLGSSRFAILVVVDFFSRLFFSGLWTWSGRYYCRYRHKIHPPKSIRCHSGFSQHIRLACLSFTRCMARNLLRWKKGQFFESPNQFFSLFLYVMYVCVLVCVCIYASISSH